MTVVAALLCWLGLGLALAVVVGRIADRRDHIGEDGED